MPDDVRSTSMGAGGEDILMSPRAQESVPLSIEAKNTERLNLWGALEQAESNCPSARAPCVVFTRNRAKVYATIPWELLLSLLQDSAAAKRDDVPSATLPAQEVTDALSEESGTDVCANEVCEQLLRAQQCLATALAITERKSQQCDAMRE